LYDDCKWTVGNGTQAERRCKTAIERIFLSSGGLQGDRELFDIVFDGSFTVPYKKMEGSTAVCEPSIFA